MNGKTQFFGLILPFFRKYGLKPVKHGLNDFSGGNPFWEKIGFREKIAFKGALDGLNVKIPSLSPSLKNFSAALTNIQGEWQAQMKTLEKITKDTDLDSLLTMSAMQEKLHIGFAQKRWLDIVEDTRQFTEQAFVSYS